MIPCFWSLALYTQNNCHVFDLNMGLCLEISVRLSYSALYYYLPCFLSPVTHKLLCLPHSQGAPLSVQRSIFHLKKVSSYPLEQSSTCSCEICGKGTQHKPSLVLLREKRKEDKYWNSQNGNAWGTLISHTESSSIHIPIGTSPTIKISICSQLHAREHRHSPMFWSPHWS